jgi:pyruvyltransferase
LLTPVLLKKYGLTPVHSKIETAEVVSIGSILDILPNDFAGFIVGSGLVRDTVRVFPNAKILAVRGELTRDRIGAPRTTILGDPGLLAPRLLSKRASKKYAIGIVPHYVDKYDERIKQISQRGGNNVAVINVQRHPMQVIADIDECECIFSSSLHGIVVADSLGIPSAWMVLSEKVAAQRFKFYDYKSVFGMTCEPINISGTENLTDLSRQAPPTSARIQEIQDRLDSVFITLSRDILDYNRNRNQTKK